ncbi:CDP-diacylglycerol diphosphatase [Acetobacteraceae bacterium]|nr:CDP-diacylglycerol diphosphatase [Acetobacteraceae bacterium]
MFPSAFLFIKKKWKMRLFKPTPHMIHKKKPLFRCRKAFIAILSVVLAFFLCVLAYFYFYLPHQTHHASILWHLISQRCVKHPNHKPCLTYNGKEGYVLFKDMYGKAQVLLLPTKRLYGVESPALNQKETPNYFKIAWENRGIVSQLMHQKIPDELLSLSINSRFGRSQNQLHIHMSCLKKDVADKIHALNPKNLPEEISLLGNPYKIILAATLDPSPFRLLSGKEHLNSERMAKKTLIVTQAPEGKFYLLTGETDLLHLDWGSAEELQDHDCKSIHP